MMNPEMMRLAEEQMRRMSPDDLARMQRHLASNPDLIRLASDTMKNMTPHDLKLAAQQLNQTSPHEMLSMAEKIAAAKPEDFAAMKAQADARSSYTIAGAKTLKQRGNELHGRGRYADAAAKYELAKDALKNVPSVPAHALRVQCALNLMSCYLKSDRFEECVKEGSEVLLVGCDGLSDAVVVKAYYRRGQAYRALGNLQAAVADLSKAHEISPEDETIARALMDAQGKLAAEAVAMPKGIVIEELVEESSELSSTQSINSCTGYTVSEPHEEAENSTQCDSSEVLINNPAAGATSFQNDTQETMMKSFEDPVTRQMLVSMMENMSPDVMAHMCEQFNMELSSENAAKAQHVMSSLTPQGLERMIKWMDRAQRGAELAKKTKDWLLARKGLVFAIFMLILAFFLVRFGFGVKATLWLCSQLTTQFLAQTKQYK